ncbi:hypothetical protein [Taibaiella koreensis]|uniref:hypothetical protein n=1 Tax=Taibaiella koreensis TaxID=1268548 RepID=UPI000E59A0E8|nr:hypothetical protein [Taibaiella koreensis]
MKHLSLKSFLFLLCCCAFSLRGQAQGVSANPSSAAAANAAGAGAPGGGGSNPNFISIDSANKMLGSYLFSINADADNNSNVQSFIMDADAIREYLSDPAIKKVKIMLAHNLKYINEGNSGVNCGYKSGGLTVIMAGYDAQSNYIFAPGNKVMDNSVPCPSICPSNGTASDMLLH